MRNASVGPSPPMMPVIRLTYSTRSKPNATVGGRVGAGTTDPAMVGPVPPKNRRGRRASHASAISGSPNGMNSRSIGVPPRRMTKPPSPTSPRSSATSEPFGTWVRRSVQNAS